jgi:NAD(P)H-hydrate epimerase
MRALEAAAFAAGVSEADLQQRAATAVAEEVARLVAPGERVAVLVGHGNNGRDGMLAGMWLAERQRQVEVVLAPRHGVTEAEQTRLRELGARVVDAEATSEVLPSARVAVDALAGIGTRGALREPLASLARKVNEVSGERGDAVQVVAVDVPSGIDADTGDVPGEVVWADCTVTLGAVKQGLLRFPGAERVGRLAARAIGIPQAALASLPFDVLDEHALADAVPHRPASAHKYRFGRVLVVAGSDYFLGAPVLCAGGAARAGAGLVTLASTAAVRQAVAAYLPEITYAQAELDAQRLRPYLESHAVLVVGPGLGRESSTVRFVHDLLRLRREVARPGQALVVDADGLYALSELQEWWAELGPNALITPHAGELARLIGGQPTEDTTDWARTRRLAVRWGCYLIAKGPFTCIAGPDGQVAVWPRANSALATGGTGDVLAGLVGGLLAQGAAVWDAARVGVAAHALSAAHIVETHGWRTLLASDLLPEIPAALARLASTQRR